MWTREKFNKIRALAEDKRGAIGPRMSARRMAIEIIKQNPELLFDDEFNGKDNLMERNFLDIKTWKISAKGNIYKELRVGELLLSVTIFRDQQAHWKWLISCNGKKIYSTEWWNTNAEAVSNSWETIVLIEAEQLKGALVDA